jgi:hypothetical protein
MDRIYHLHPASIIDQVDFIYTLFSGYEVQLLMPGDLYFLVLFLMRNMKPLVMEFHLNSGWHNYVSGGNVWYLCHMVV